MKHFLNSIFILISLSITAQDIHFTMYDAMPIITNPALLVFLMEMLEEFLIIETNGLELVIHTKHMLL